MPQLKLIRSFIAIEISDELHKAIDQIQKNLKMKIPRARWVKPDSIHLTIKFLGGIDLQQVQRISGHMNDWIEEFHSYELQPQGLGAFPNTHHPRVLWIGFRHVPDIHYNLVGKIESALFSMGFPREPKRHFPHLTLSRFNEPVHIPEFDALCRNEMIELPDFQVKQVTLFQSDLTQRGARYTPLFSAPLPITLRRKSK